MVFDIFLFITFMSFVAHFSLKFSLKRHSLHEDYFGKKSGFSQRGYVKHMMSFDRWNDDFNKETLFFVRFYIVVNYINTLYVIFLLACTVFLILKEFF